MRKKKKQTDAVVGAREMRWKLLKEEEQLLMEEGREATVETCFKDEIWFFLCDWFFDDKRLIINGEFLLFWIIILAVLSAVVVVERKWRGFVWGWLGLSQIVILWWLKCWLLLLILGEEEEMMEGTEWVLGKIVQDR